MAEARPIYLLSWGLALDKENRAKIRSARVIWAVDFTTCNAAFSADTSWLVCSTQGQMRLSLKVVSVVSRNKNTARSWLVWLKTPLKDNSNNKLCPKWGQLKSMLLVWPMILSSRAQPWVLVAQHWEYTSNPVQSSIVTENRASGPRPSFSGYVRVCKSVTLNRLCRYSTTFLLRDIENIKINRIELWHPDAGIRILQPPSTNGNSRDSCHATWQ